MQSNSVSDRILINNEEAGQKLTFLAGGRKYDPANEQIISRHVDGKLWGGVIYSADRGRSVEMHMASLRPRWINRCGLWAVFNYPFVQLNKTKLIGFTPGSNKQAIMLNLHVGFKIETRIKDACEDSDLIVFSMYREDCRWLDGKPRAVILDKEYRREYA